MKTKLFHILIGNTDLSAEMRRAFGLPTRYGGLAMQIAHEEAAGEYQNSMEMNSALIQAIYSQAAAFEIDQTERATKITGIRKRKEDKCQVLLERLKEELLAGKFRQLQLASEKGASMWLTSLPLKEYGFRLNKQQFIDAICMRYDLHLSNVPRKCSCGEAYSINHCLTCKNGGFVIMRHNAVRDLTHELLYDVCKDVRVEPELLPVVGKELTLGTNCRDGAKADVSAVGFFIPLNRAFLDIRVLNPLAQSNVGKDLNQMYVSHEKSKKREYNSRILQVEKGSFVPLVFGCTGGAGPEASAFLKQLALKLSKKRGELYSQTITFLRRRYSYEIIRTCVISFRGERVKASGRHINQLDIGLIDQPSENF